MKRIDLFGDGADFDDIEITAFNYNKGRKDLMLQC